MNHTVWELYVYNLFVHIYIVERFVRIVYSFNKSIQGIFTKCHKIRVFNQAAS